MPKTRVEAWSVKELSRFLEHVRKDPLFPLWRLAATTGMRRGELAGLTWRALDLDGARLSVEQQLLQTRGGPSFGPPKSSRSVRRSHSTRRRVASCGSIAKFNGSNGTSPGRPTTTATSSSLTALGTPIQPNRLTERFHELRKAAGLPTGSLHALRHTAATLALTEGVPVHIVAARLGDDPAVVRKTYAHLLPQSDEQAAERVAAALA